jgi:DNA topoisomerase I
MRRRRRRNENRLIRIIAAEGEDEKARKAMMEQQNFTMHRGATARSALSAAKVLASKLADRQPKLRGKRTVEALARELGLTLGDQSELTIRRRKSGKVYAFIRADGTRIRHAGTIRRLNAMAVPPAYVDVRYAADPNSHLQAVGRDAAGRLQYRYHADWEKVREHRKANRLGRLVNALPKIRRNVSQILAGDEPTRDFALAAVIELVTRTAIRAGNESYMKLSGTRGATTLMKSNVQLEGECIVLSFKAKGGKAVRKECGASKLVRAIGILHDVPGRRLFQYRDKVGRIHKVNTAAVNAFLRDIAGIKISLKDFRTLMASATVVETLAKVEPAESMRGRKKQVLDAVRSAADELSNTPTICRKSYVHDTIVTAFENGALARIAAKQSGYRSQSKREQLLAQVVAEAG